MECRHWLTLVSSSVAFKVYDMDRDGLISNGELFLVLKMMVGNNLKDQQLQQIVDKTIMEADKDGWVAGKENCYTHYDYPDFLLLFLILAEMES